MKKLPAFIVKLKPYTKHAKRFAVRINSEANIDERNRKFGNSSMNTT